jgi:hypothetical protein
LDITLEQAQQVVPPVLALVEECPEGVLLRTRADTLEWAATFLVSLDCPFTVRKPLELKETLQQLADSIKRWAAREPAPV